MKRPVHIPVISKSDLIAMAGPGSVLHSLKPAKSQRRRGEPEHDAQVRLFELLDESDDLDVANAVSIIHAIPQFTDRMQGWRQAKMGERYKAEGQRKGMPDVHVPVSRGFGPQHDMVVYHSLYVEMKFESYPSDDQIAMFRALADAGNAVVVVRFSDVDRLASHAFTTIKRYLNSRVDFTEFAHPKHIYLPI